MILNFDEYLDLLREQELKEHVDFNDEIVSIEEIEPQEMVDISLDGNNVFFANDILIHNCAVNQVENVDNSKISDSMGTAMIADFILFMLQSEEMKENSNMILKVTKNRFNGRTDQWIMDIDYPKMRFSDHVGLNGSTFDSGKQAEDSKKFVDSELQKISNEIKQQSSNSVNDILAGLGIE